jgi:ribonuclease VapC
MVIDTSAIGTMLFVERDVDRYVKAIEDDQERLMSAATAVEVGVVARTRLGEIGLVRWREIRFEFEIEIVPFTPHQAEIAVRAFSRFGKGLHRARLNFGDCCAYAAAIDLGEPLLFKGGDFHLTDVEAVPLPADVQGLHDGDQ